MNKKKIMWVVLLVIFIIAIIAIVVTLSSKKVSNVENSNNINIGFNTIYNKSSNNVNELENQLNESSDINNNDIMYQKTELDDGILYSIDGKKYKADFVVGDNYFDATITDICLNHENYMNKNIQIEGMYFENLPFTFVGRYSTSSLCPYCPSGYSYFEYQLKGKLDRKFTQEKEWIKIIGTLAVGNDETSNYEDYYYLDVLSLEVMNERGLETIKN